jgi:hypothetical protein
VLERLPGVSVDAAKKCPPHAALDSMKGALCTESYKLRTRASHTSRIPHLPHAGCQVRPQARVGKV